MSNIKSSKSSFYSGPPFFWDNNFCYRAVGERHLPMSPQEKIDMLVALNTYICFTEYGKTI